MAGPKKDVICWTCFLPQCGSAECLTEALSSFVNHTFRMIHHTHTSLQLWGWKMVVSTDDHFNHPLIKATIDYSLELYINFLPFSTGQNSFCCLKFRIIKGEQVVELKTLNILWYHKCFPHGDSVYFLLYQIIYSQFVCVEAPVNVPASLIKNTFPVHQGFLQLCRSCGSLPPGECIIIVSHWRHKPVGSLAGGRCCVALCEWDKWLLISSHHN